MTQYIRPVAGLTALCIAALLALTSVPAMAQGDRVLLRQDVPDRYVVQRGDTLWDISGRFLREPWLWPEIWELNPQIENPHLIYPGDVIHLVWVDGRPRLRLERDGIARDGVPGSDRLSPQTRVYLLEEAIQTIPLEVIRPFLGRAVVVGRNELDNAPYLLRAVDGSLMSAEGHRIYARGMSESPVSEWTVLRPGDAFRDPDDNRILGYEGTYVGEVQVERAGDPSTVVMLSSQMEARPGDKLLPLAGQDIHRSMVPKAPRVRIDGRIIRRMGGGDYIGQYHIVALNRGSDHGLEPGDVLAIWRAGVVIRDDVGSRGMRRSRNVHLPDERVGEVLVFRTTSSISFGLVMRSIEDIAAGDFVRNP